MSERSVCPRFCVRSGWLMKLPNFFIVGAPKCGTTSLYHYLNQHPAVFMSPVKEPCYFALEMRPERFAPEYRARVAASSLCSTWQEYRALFDGVRAETAVGEASVCYLWSPTAARNIAEAVPGAKIVAVLRNPVERAWSQYLHGWVNGDVRVPFRALAEASFRAKEEEFSPAHPFLEFGNYYEQVRRYFELFPRSQVRIYFYEDGLVSIAADVFGFLNVDGFRVDDSRRHLEAASAETGNAVFRVLKSYGLWNGLRRAVPGRVRPLFRRVAFRRTALPVMTTEDRRFVVEYYREDVARLGALVGRDLGAWNI
jgi:hypothetical protein